MREKDHTPEPRPWQIPINAVVWLIERDMTTERRWVDGYDEDGKTIYLRTIQNPNKNNRGMKGYPASAVGNYIHRSYQEARLCIKMNAVVFPREEAAHGKDGHDARN